MGAILLLIQAAAAVLPEIQQVLPSVETLINGGTITTAEEEALAAATTSLNSQAAEAAAQIDPDVA